MNVSISPDGNDPAVVMVALQAPMWEFHFWVHLSDLARLRSIREADWTARRALQIGEAGGIPVHWCINPEATVSALIGEDAESWHIAFVMPVDTIDRLAAEAADLLPPSHTAVPHPGQLRCPSDTAGPESMPTSDPDGPSGSGLRARSRQGEGGRS